MLHNIVKITSPSNQKIKLFASLKYSKYRKKYGLFIAEGEILVKDIVRRGIKVDTIVVTENYKDDICVRNLIERGADLVICNSKCFKKISDIGAEEGIIIVNKIQSKRYDELPQKGIILCTYCIQDPGNLGTLIRTADALGAEAVFVVDSADPWGSKAVRSSMGSIFSIPIFVGTKKESIRLFKNIDAFLIGSSSKQGCRPEDIHIAKDLCVLFVGNEAEGLPDNIFNMVDSVVHIPLERDSESLNVAIAGSIILYELKKHLKHIELG